MKITENSPHVFSLYLVKVASSWRDRTELVAHCFSQNCDSTVWNLCRVCSSISWYASCWNFIKFCCLQWKLYTKNLGGPLIMAHHVYTCKYQTCLKTMFKMSSLCSNANSETWMPLLDRFVNELLIFASHLIPSSTRCHASVYGAVCTNLLQQFVLSVHGLLGNSAWWIFIA